MWRAILKTTGSILSVSSASAPRRRIRGLVIQLFRNTRPYLDAIKEIHDEAEQISGCADSP
jgi:hypothetical protein